MQIDVDGMMEELKEDTLEELWQEFRTYAQATERTGIDGLLEYLERTNIKETPASTRYHLAEAGGLLEHSINVCKVALKLWDSLGQPGPKESVILTSLFHDIGKHKYYNKEYYKQKPLLKSGKPPATPYERNKTRLPVPHEVASIHILSQYINLTEEENWAILQHNGMYGDLRYSLQGDERPLQMIIHWADMWASRVMEG